MRGKGIFGLTLLVAVVGSGFLGFHISTRRIWEHLELFSIRNAGIWLRQTDSTYATVFYLKPGKGKTVVDSNYQCVLLREGDRIKTAELQREPGDEYIYFCDWGKLFIGHYDVRVVEKGKEDEAVKKTDFDVPGPNLKVPTPWIQVSPMKPMKSNPFTVRVSVLNNGKATARNVLVRIQLFKDSMAVTTPKAAEVSELPQGEAATLSFEIPGLPVGRYEIRVLVDPANDIDELYEKDNESRREVWVSQKLLLR